MRATSKLLALALTAALQPAVAGVVSLNFEDVKSNGLLGERYASQGVSFSGNAWGVTSNQTPCTGSLLFSRPGSCGALLLGLTAGANPTSAFTSFTIDVAGGFIDEFSFVYGVRSQSGVTVEIFDELNGRGNSLQLLSSLSGSACATGSLQFCQWYSTSLQFSGTAKSIVISGRDQRLMLDDLKFTTPGTSGGTLPEPASLALAIGALGALGWARKRTAR